MVDGLDALTGGEVDVLLTLRHAGDVLAERDEFLLRGGVEQQQILQLVLLRAVVVQGADLELAAEVLPELLVALPVVAQHPLKLRAQLLLEVGGDDLELAVML